MHGQAILSPSHPTGTDHDRRGAQKTYPETSLFHTAPKIRTPAPSNGPRAEISSLSTDYMTCLSSRVTLIPPTFTEMGPEKT